jgi:RNA polymerase sigma factor (sigma-70 family)
MPGGVVRYQAVGAAIAVVTGPKGWDQLVATYGRVVWLSLVALGVAPDHASELAQAAWTRLLEQHDRGALGELKMPGLVIAQARFLALDAMRRQKLEGRHRLEAVALDDHDAIDPERQAIARERLHRAGAALGLCSPQEQRIFRAIYDDPSRPHAEVAVEVALSVQRVRQILCEVRRKLRAAMEG